MTINYNQTTIRSENWYMKNKKDMQRLKMPMPNEIK